MQIITCAQIYLRQHSKAENVKSIVNKLFDAIKSFVVTYDPDNSTFSLSFEEKNLYTMSDISQSLTEVIVAIGQLAQNVNTPICFFVDEMQYLKKKELGAFLTAIHRANQLGYPIMVVGAGLPRLVKLLSDVRSYSERLFIYKEIDSLSKEQARLAIINPALSINKTYSEEAINKIIEITKGYPFFIQQFCQTLFNGELDEIISLKNVDSATKEYYQTLDAGFFHSRYERCSEGEKRFIFAMVDCGSLPCTISNVAINMNKEVKAISPTRAQLIDKGIIYSVKHSELDFTVPDFDEYLKRIRKTI